MRTRTRYLLSILPLNLLPVAAAQVSGTGSTTRYFDCCKPSCGYAGKLTPAAGSSVVQSCDIHDAPVADFNAQSACAGGTAYTCSDQTPWAVSDSLAYGFAAVNIAGGTEASWCCACYELTFTSSPSLVGKKMVVQATNTGGDLGANHFDLAIPGGGFGIYDACTTEWKNASTDWGERYGGISRRSQCDTFADALKPACYWRFDWFQNADNPSVAFTQVACPAALTARTGCVRADDQGPVPSSSPGSSSDPSSRTSTPASRNTSASTAKPVTSIASVSAPASSLPVGAYGQCGGKNWNGGTLCVVGYTCIPQAGNPYYSQCLPTPKSSQPPSPPQSTATTRPITTTRISTLSNQGPTPSPSGGAAPYTQCGGLGWAGGRSCTAGYTCQVTNPYYSQCVPNGAPAGTVPAYGQCGGVSYSGLKACAPGYACKAMNPYYSQCLPV
ncbi:glycoside hydrolase family 45 protein [Phlyctema vagabunda]|uniref:Cellulase n=1 Tax=Phlyctema vagabunda TaxID=108571 RepID=A0ABR4PWL5_9HELO